MRWIVETYGKNGFRILQVIFGINITQAAQMFCEETGQTLELRGNFISPDSLTFTDDMGRAVVIRREKLDDA